MKIGIFDSGLGGLGVGLRMIDALPQYDYIYLGDTQRVPYGNRSQESIYRFTREAVDYLFSRNCLLVVLACNTASAEALRRIQQEYVPTHYPDRKVLGVLIPAAEVAAASGKRIGVIATAGAVGSGAWPREIHRIREDVEVFQQAAPLLVPLVENDGIKWAEPILAEYLAPLHARDIDTLVLGCTHYIFLKEQAQCLSPGVKVISPEELVPERLADYLRRHQEIASRLSTGRIREFMLTDMTDEYIGLAQRLTGRQIEFRHVVL
ncbi:MAG TPA: glutamate racemase [Fimbriimonadaceae bacterium]|nr:glutamate racemase [Fimbriimonadaceae bacterium]